MNDTTDTQSDVGVLINQNHGPITVNNVYEGDSGDARTVYFVDMSVPELKAAKSERLRWIFNAYIKIITNYHVIFGVLLVAIPLIVITKLSLWGEVFTSQYYTYCWGIVFLINGYFGGKVVVGYRQIIEEWKAEIRGINHELTRRKLISKKR
jgi:hypothetical protein